MGLFFLRRLASVAALLLIVAAITFLALRVLPGDPLEAMLGGVEFVSEEVADEFRRQHGLDLPIPIQFVIWLGGILTGDLGSSLRTGQPVTQALAHHFEPTMVLGFISFSMVVIVGVTLGVVAGLSRNSLVDRAIQQVLNLGLTAPNISVAVVLILVFGVYLRWLPVLGYVSPSDNLLQSMRSLALPAFVLSLPFLAETGRQTRAAVKEALRQAHIRTGRAKGLSPRVLIFRYVLRTAAIPTIVVLGLQFGRLFAGTVIIETMFVIPGLGRLVVESILYRDFAVVQGCVLLIALLVALGNLLADVLSGVLDPRQREF